MPKIDLLPCPFCGRRETLKVLSFQSENHKFLRRVVCSTVEGGCGASTIWNLYTPEEAAEEWNTRASGWISCSAKLPEVDEPVLIYEPYNEEMVVASLDCDKTGFSNDDYWYGLKSVPFWMPLPKSPEEEVK
jgi:hypothetical protein